MRWPWRRPDPPVYVDPDDHVRRRLIREAEYQAELDAQAKVLRVSGRSTADRSAPPVVRPGLVTWHRGRP